MIIKLGSLFQITSTKTVALKLRWRHIRLAIKPRYLGNHASLIRRYYRSLSGSHGRSFRIRHENRVKGLLAYVWQWCQIWLAIKPLYLGNYASQIRRYYGSLSGSHGRSFRIRHENRAKRPLADKSRWHHIRLAIKPRCLGNYASQIKSYYGTLSGSGQQCKASWVL